MKKISFLCLIFVFAVNFSFSQGTAVNSTGASADSSAMLDVSSTSKGILIPRMTKAEKLLILSPANGLLIYQTNDTTGFWYFNSVKWVQAIGTAGTAGTAGTTGATGATGVSGITGPTGATTGTERITHISAVISQNVWLTCYNYCYNLSAVPATPANGVTYTDWRMPSISEAVYYRNSIGGSSGSDRYVWTSDGDGSGYWIVMNEKDAAFGAFTSIPYYCRCVR